MEKKVPDDDDDEDDGESSDALLFFSLFFLGRSERRSKSLGPEFFIIYVSFSKWAYL